MPEQSIPGFKLSLVSGVCSLGFSRVHLLSPAEIAFLFLVSEEVLSRT